MGITGEIALDTDVREIFHEERAFALKSECKMESDFQGENSMQREPRVQR